MKRPRDYIYGSEWGDVDRKYSLAYVKKTYVEPFISNDKVGVEIGSGGGRWTRYMLGLKKLYVVDYHVELLKELKKNYNEKNMIFVNNNGSDFPGIPDNSVDFVFSFAVFVHLDLDIIVKYLRNIKKICKPSADIVIQYADKLKPGAMRNRGFAFNTPPIMNNLIAEEGFRVKSNFSNNYNWDLLHLGLDM
jgi:ubiquinone/menaquinone biosynthesis C-methylase UbiE